MTTSTDNRDISTPRKPLTSIKVIVTSVALAITTIAVVSVGTVMERNARRALSSEIEARLLEQARNLARASSSPLLSEFPELTLHPLVKGIQAKEGNLGFVVVVDHQGRIQGHADARLLGETYEPPPQLEGQPTEQPLAPQESLTANQEVLVASSPIFHADRTIGTVSIGLRTAYIETLIGGARHQAMIVLGIALAVGVLATLVMMTLLLRPIDVIRRGLDRIGQGDLDTPVRLSDRTEFGLLAHTVNNMATQLKKAQKSMMERERLTHEIKLARSIQQSLLPRNRIQAESFVVDGRQDSAAEVGGDYYDFFPLPKNRIGLAIADVSGKGMGGCVVMSMLSALLHAYKDTHTSPRELLIKLDERLIETLSPETFVTMFYGILDPASGTLTFASAAHCPAMIYRKTTGKVELHWTKGIPIGAIRGGVIRDTLEDYEIQLDPGDMLLQYTDGINEAFDPQRFEQFGFERMQQLLAAEATGGYTTLLKNLRFNLNTWRGTGDRQDDETLLVVSREKGSRGDSGEMGVDIDFTETLKELDRVRRDGDRLILNSSLNALPRLREWLSGSVRLSTLGESEFEILSLALYEACSNIIEHGYGSTENKEFYIWRVPETTDTSLTWRFVILDQGTPFSGKKWEETDFSKTGSRRRGHGFGLDIINRAMAEVDYRPGTPEGNITTLIFDPDQIGQERKVKYA